jgi:hypothetical protein
MNSSVWAVLAAMVEKKLSISEQLLYFRATFEGDFFQIFVN